MQHLRTLFLDGLLGDERRKTGWMRAEAAGDPGPWRQQAILGRGRWDADGLRDIVREYVVENLATDDAVLVIDETGFLKQGKTSCGVARQYTGSAGKITNCQIGVFAAYVSVRGLEILEERYRRKSTLITAQLPLAAWHEMIGEATLADAILDRIVHNAHRITLEGDSMRKRKTPTLLTGGEITEINHP